MTDLEKRVAELERQTKDLQRWRIESLARERKLQDRLAELEHMVEELECRLPPPDIQSRCKPAPEPVCKTCGGAGQLSGFQNGRLTTSDCPDCQPAPEPEQREKWEPKGSVAIQLDRWVRECEDHFGQDLAAEVRNEILLLRKLLNAHGITPTSKPIDKARGRELMREGAGPLTMAQAERWMESASDFIASACGVEGE